MVALTTPGSPTPRLASATSDGCRLEVLGPPEVLWGERVVDFRTRRELVLLVYLALTDAAQPRDRLAALFWPDREPEDGRRLLRQALSRLRHRLAEAGQTTPEALTALRASRDTLGREVVRLARDGFPIVEVDAERLGAASRANPADPAIAELAETVAVYRGPFLEGVVFDDAPELDEWIEQQRAHWQRQAAGILGRLARAQLARRAPAEALATGRRWLGLDPVSEAAHRVVMRALAELGDRTGALVAYAGCQETLRAKLGVEVSPETAALAERLRSAVPKVPSREDEDVGDTGDPQRAGDVPFVGREAEFARLVEAYRAARRVSGELAVIAGEAGIGKTRLAEEFARWATLEGADVLRGQGYPGPGTLPYQPLVDALRPRLARERAPEDLIADVWLSELARLFPELRERYPDLAPPPTPLASDATAPGRLHEALAQLLLALGRPAKAGGLVLFCDDAQWVDPATRAFLQFWINRQREEDHSHLLLLTVRSESASVDPALRSWLAAMEHRAPSTRIDLHSWNVDETKQVVRAWLSQTGRVEGEDADRLTRRLYARTEGQPYFLVETLAEFGAARDGVAPLVPNRVRDLIRGQLLELDRAARDLLAALAVLGAHANLERLGRVAELDERAALAALDDLARRHLVVERAHPCAASTGTIRDRLLLCFPRELVRDVFCAELGDARRQIFHRRALDVLASESLPPPVLLRAHPRSRPGEPLMVASGPRVVAGSRRRRQRETDSGRATDWRPRDGSHAGRFA